MQTTPSNAQAAAALCADFNHPLTRAAVESAPDAVLTDAHSLQGGTTLRLTAAGIGSGTRVPVCAPDGQLMLRPGRSYVLHFRYYVARGAYTGPVGIHFSVADPVRDAAGVETPWKPTQDNASAMVGWNTATTEWLDAHAILTHAGEADAPLFVCLSGRQGARTIFLEGVTLTELAQGSSGIYCEAGYPGGQDEVYVGAPGTPVCVQTPERPGYRFLSWFSRCHPDDPILPPDRLPETPVTLFARWEISHFVQDFSDPVPMLSVIDRDMEIHHRTGPDDPDIFEGETSLRRKGESDAVRCTLLTWHPSECLTLDARYRLRLWIRPERGTTGFTLAGSKSPYYSHSFACAPPIPLPPVGEPDGAFHEVELEFRAKSRYPVLCSPPGSKFTIGRVEIVLCEE